MNSNKNAKKILKKKHQRKTTRTSKGKFSNPDYPVVPVETAIAATTEWRNFNKKIQEEYHLPIEYLNEYIRAFFIPASDLQAITNMIQSDDKISGCRVYLGMEDVPGKQSDAGKVVKLFIVAVQDFTQPGPPGTGIDIVYSPDTGKSLVYDFTCPCPSTCDVLSVLYESPTGL